MARAFVYPVGDPNAGKPLEIERGGDVVLVIEVKQGDVGQTGADTAQDVTGWTTQLTLTPDVNSLTKTLIKAGAVVNGAAGTISFSLARADTKDLEPGTYDADAWRIDSGSARQLVFGPIIVRGGSLHPAAA